MQRREQFFDVVYDLFAAKGDSISVSDIAEAAGANPQSVSTQFGSTDYVLRQVLEQEIDGFFRTLQSEIHGAEQQDFESGLESVFTFVLNYFHENRRLRFWRNIPLIEDDELRRWCRRRINSYEKELGDRLTALYQRAADQGEIKADNLEGSVALFVAMVHGLLDGMLLYHDCFIDIMVAAVKAWDAYWDGIKSSPA